MTQRIMFVSDARNDELISAIEARDCEVVFEGDPERAAERLSHSKFDLLVIDLSDATTAIEFMKNVRSSAGPTQPSLLVLAEWGTGQATLAFSHGAAAFEPNPCEPFRFVAAAEKLLRPRMVMTANAADD